MVVYVDSAEALYQNWNGGAGDGDGVFVVTQDFTIISPSNFPLSYTANVNVTFGGPYTRASPYIITINLPSPNAWTGLFVYNSTNANIITIQNVQFNISRAVLPQLNSILFATNASSNPNTTIDQVYVNVSNNVVFPNFNSWGGFICSLDTNLLASSITITNSIYSGPISAKGGGFIASGYVAGGTTTSCTIAFTNCVATINIPSTLGVQYAGGFCGNQMRLHYTTITGCIVQIASFGSSNTQIGGFFGEQANSFSITNSYVVITDTTSYSPNPTFSWIAQAMGPSNTSLNASVANSYFVCYPSTTTPAFVLYDTQSADNLSSTNSAYQNTTVLRGSTDINTITNYFYSGYGQTVSTLPFSSWSYPSVWSDGQDVYEPFILTAFTTGYFQGSNYNDAIDIPSLTNLCIFEGTRILTTDGYVPVENLTEDHVLCTHAGHTTRIIRIHEFENPSIMCYKIAKGSMGPSVPHDDVYLTGGHAIYRGFDDVFIHPDHHQDLFEHAKAREWGKSRYFCVETENYYEDLLIASGLPIEGYGKPLPTHHIWKCNENRTAQCIMIKT